LRKVTPPDKGACLRLEYREVGETTRRERSTHRTLERRVVFGKQANRKRGTRARSDARTAISRYLMHSEEAMAISLSPVH
jgi:hypothetical protein